MAFEFLVGATVGAAVDKAGAVAGAVGSVAGLGPVKEWLQGCKTRLVAGRSLPRNHDLVKGVRTAHLCALDQVARRQADLLARLPAHEIGADEGPFAENLRRFLDDRLAITTDGRIDHEVLTRDDVEHVLTTLGAASTAADHETLVAELRQGAERRALAEIERDAGRAAPPLFRRVFAGEGAAGWYDGFSLFVAEALKTDERFRSIFFATELVDIRTAVATLNAHIARVLRERPELGEVLDGVHHRLDRLQKTADRTDMRVQVLGTDMATGFDAVLAAIAATKGVDELPLRRVLEKLGETDVPVTEIPARLERAADELLRLRDDLSRLRNEGPQFDAIRAAALAHIEAGEFDAARTALRRGRETARQMREEASRIEAGFLVDEARVDRLDLAYDAATSKLEEALRIDPIATWAAIELGDLWMIRGATTRARDAYCDAIVAAQQFGDERDLSICYNRLGDILLAHGNLTDAQKSFYDCLNIRLRLATANPADASRQYDLAVSYNKVGEVLFAQSRFTDALQYHCNSLIIERRLAAAEPANASQQRSLAVSLSRIGETLFAQRRFADALQNFRRSLDISRRLVASNPTNIGWRRDLAVSLEKIGDVLLAQGKPKEALKCFRESLDIRARHATEDRANFEWQRDLAVSYNKIGEVLVIQNNHAEAFINFRDSLDIRARLIAAQPTNIKLLRDLSACQDRVGSSLFELGKIAEALNYFRDSLDIARNLAAENPTNPLWQRDLIISLLKLAQAAPAEAKEHLSAALDIARRLARENQLAPSDAWMIDKVGPWLEAASD